MFKHHGFSILKMQCERAREKFNMKSNPPETKDIDRITLLENEVKSLRSLLNKNDTLDSEENNAKSNKLQKKAKRLQAEVMKLRELLSEKNKTVNGLVDAMIELDEQKESWRKKFNECESLLDICRSNISDLRSEIRHLNFDNEQFKLTLEEKEFELMQEKRQVSNRSWESDERQREIRRNLKSKIPVRIKKVKD